jgi:hypothetical protein
VKVAFGKARGLHGSPRLVHDLRDGGWTVSEKTVAGSMRRQSLVARRIKRRNGLTRQDKTAPKFPDLLKRDFTAPRPNARWVGDMTEIPTAAGKLYLATVIDLYSRRLLGAATGLHPDADLGCAAIKMAVASRGGVDAVNGEGWRSDESQRSSFTPTAGRPADSSGRRNTSMMGVFSGEREEPDDCVGVGTRRTSAAVGCGQGVAAADALTGSPPAVACGAACVLALDRRGLDE